ncbi:carbon-nitrogen hydrolase [Zygosaccharomyces mellis]|uniref:Carbon-nitrogen hydrolase n=1 Tax=Zygosaccharomyces mellis TaxID=42258 RepID=A0A4C2E542_9SACH|nr:carbon-nitrogen hydrolase [Zygosaccharomyces mellis]
MNSLIKGNLAVNLKIAIVQLNPQIGQITSTVGRTWELLKKFNDKIVNTPKKPDIIIFPEFALTGYNFHSRDQILPYCSLPDKGPSYDLACKVSSMFECYTVIGYPERTKNGDKLYNSAIVINPQGELIFNYRKSFLYQTDEEWDCLENPQGFQTFPLTFQNIARDQQGNVQSVSLKTSIGICMDLSPYKFKAPFHDYEFATYNVDQGTELIICPMAWLHSTSAIAGDDNEIEVQTSINNIGRNCTREDIPVVGTQGKFDINIDNNETPRLAREDEDDRNLFHKLDKPDMCNVNYWLLRFLPFLGLKERSEWSVTALSRLILRGKLFRSSYVGAALDKYWSFKDKNAVLAIANRCGIEEGKTVFAGSSGIYKFNGQEFEGNDSLDSTNLSVELKGNLGKGNEGILYREVNFQVSR